MAKTILVSYDFNKNEIQQAVAHHLGTAPSIPVEGQFYYNTTDHIFYWWNGSSWIDAKGDEISYGSVTSQTSFGASSSDGSSSDVARADHTHGTPDHTDTEHSGIHLSALAAPLADLDVDGYKIANVGTPTTDYDAANKQYVDSLAQGLDPKASVRVATTEDIILSGTQTIDGVSVIAGDRVLVKDQDAAEDNGIWVVSASTWSRSADADTDDEVNAGMFTFVEEGTVHADSGWILATNNPIVVGTTELLFVQFSGAGQITAGDGLVKIGNTIDAVGTTDRITVNADSIDIASTYAGQSSIDTVGTITSGTWNGTTIAVADGGTGATNATDARANLGATGKYAANVGGATTIPVVHGLNSTDVVVQTYLSNALVECEVTITDADTVTLEFAVAPSASSIRVVVIG